FTKLLRRPNLPCVAWWSTTLVEPRPVLLHFCALGRRSVPLARRGLIAPVGRAPSELDAVIRIVGQLEIGRPVEHVFERERPCGTVAASVRKLPRRKLRHKHAL